ncbi:DUF1351 domain-containing protein [Lactococcus petauri]|uniref:DUF1351 domain-containing protein n=1 Tax=Lactococcus petauri TaxID=1940789 RepID=A0ABZ2SEX8_9LACT|nr:DUF1351 domain-containing protein [Lactococcus petauri]OAL09677.1 hypothetical protein A7X72_00709 [Lactococcus garvieae]MCV5951988.1 DUF1351 domain-containing protein [Lactococcus petauri]MCV5966529.1 DUF1351 domain-containing protein [Lactococcus petauri]MCV5969417.1 DUF1351 domain-containing protein [Lactococcus petauri]MCV5979843.1 DUF1351 domain-containing protein [Lactococcus petauri]
MSEISVAFEPAKIEVLDREKFEKQINSIAEANSNRVVTAETLKDDKSTRAELRKLYKSLNDEKIRIKKEYNKPLTEFETWFKKAVAVLDKAIAQIDEGVKKVEFKQKEERKEIVRGELFELTKNLELDSRIFEVMIEDWAKASNFNDYKPKKTLQDSMFYAVEQERLKQEESRKNKKNISNFAFMSGISDTPYIRMCDDGKEVSEILEIMNEDIAKEKARKEAEEAQRKVEEQKRQELVNQQLEKDFNGQDEQPQVQEEKLSEGILAEEIETLSKSEEPKKRYQATIEIEFESLEDKDRWKRCMVANGFGEFKAIDFKEIK